MSFGIKRANGIIKPQSSLLDRLISYYELDESSDHAVDSVSNLHLSKTTDAIGSNAGKINRAREWIISSPLTHVTNTRLERQGSSFTVAVWAYFYSNTSRAVVSMWGASAQWTIWVNSSSQIEWYIDPTGGINAGSTITTNTWYFISGLWEAGANVMSLQVNDTIVASQSSSGPPSNAMPFNVGSLDSSSLLMDGRIDGLGYWRRALTYSERLYLYNSGRGMKYPFNPQ